MSSTTHERRAGPGHRQGRSRRLWGTFILMAALLAAAAAAVGFFAGRMSVSNPSPVIADRTQTTTSPKGELPGRDGAVPADPRAALLRALKRPDSERERAIRIAMNAWLAADGAAAILAARDDPELGDVVNRMMQLALFAYPEMFIDHPSLLEGIPDAKQSISMAASAISMFDPDAARGMIDAHLSDSIFREAMLSTLDQLERAEQNPLAELESIVAGTGMGSRHQRLARLVERLAADDPLAAAEMIDGLPASLRRVATDELARVWSRSDPEEAARWLAEKNVQVSGDSLNRLARRWGQGDFEAADAFTDTLTGRKRALFLGGLARAIEGSKEEMLAWVSRYEDEPAYPDLMASVVQRFAEEDVGAAIELIETLPERFHLDSYRSVVRSLSFRNAEAGVALLDRIGNDSVRDELVPMVSGVWARTDAESALDWVRNRVSGTTRDQAIAAISSSLANLDGDFDTDLVLEVIDEIEDPGLRRSSVWPLLRTLGSDDEAIRLGRDYGFDRADVIALRQNRYRLRGPFLMSGDSLAPASGTVRPRSIHQVADKDADGE